MVMVVVRLKPPKTPFTVAVKVATAAERLTFRVSELLAEVGLGLKDAETPLGERPDTRCEVPKPRAEHELTDFSASHLVSVCLRRSHSGWLGLGRD
jgi:hypothetical protein